MTGPSDTLRIDAARAAFSIDRLMLFSKNAVSCASVLVPPWTNGMITKTRLMDCCASGICLTLSHAHDA